MDAFFKIWATVGPKMASIAQGTSSNNPTYEEESAFDNAWEAVKDVRSRMDEFRRKHGWTIEKIK
jgi:hypothetical protein